jgi:uncharacterized protein (TIGR02246 family)
VDSSSRRERFADVDALERLVAIQEIRDQIARYAIWFDDKNWDDFAGLWADDASFAGPGMAFEGKQAVLEFLTSCLPTDYNGKQRNATAPTERTAPSRARARTDVVWITMDFENQIVARYDDIFKLLDGQWLFESRTEVVVPYRAGGPPMSDAAMAVSSTTMRPVPAAGTDR